MARVLLPAQRRHTLHSKHVAAMSWNMNRYSWLFCGCGVLVVTACPSTPLQPPPVEPSLLLTPRAGSVIHGQTVQFTPPFEGPAASWSVDGVPGGMAQTGTISSTGLYLATGSSAVHTILAVSAADPTIAAVATFASIEPVAVSTAHNDLGRTGQNLGELALTPASVNLRKFGKVFAMPVDGWLYTQPLYHPNVVIPGRGTHNIVVVATEHDSIYAFDADAPGPPLWQVSALAPNETTLTPADVDGVTDLTPEIGITGTPVIDPTSGTLYLVAASKTAEGAITQRLHALELATGAQRPGSPVEVQAVVPGTAPDGQGGLVAFSAKKHLQRPALLLSKGVVWLAFGSHGDKEPYHGWVLGYDAATLGQVAAFNTTPNGSESSVWQAGGGIAADQDGALYFETANGDFDADEGGSNFGDCFVKLGPSGQLLDWFAPFDQEALSRADLDLGSGGPMLLPDQRGPHPHLLAGGGKAGVLYVLDRDALGHFHEEGDSQVVARVEVAPGVDPTVGGAIGSTPAWWSGRLYLAPANDRLKVYSVANGELSAKPVSRSPTPLRGGNSVSISANGPSGGIAWLVEGGSPTLPAILHAFDANDVSDELFNSSLEGSDAAGLAAKFMVPTITNGRVYVPTQTEVSVYGLLP